MTARNKYNQKKKNSPAADEDAEGDPISAVTGQAGAEELRLGRSPVTRVVPAAAAGGLLRCLLAAFGHRLLFSLEIYEREIAPSAPRGVVSHVTFRNNNKNTDLL